MSLPISVPHAGAEATGIRSWYAILGQLVRAFRYTIPGIFVSTSFSRTQLAPASSGNLPVLPIP